MVKRSMFLVLLVLVLSSSAFADVVINEVMYNPSTSQADDTDLEWVELYNTGSSSVDLSAWTLDGNNFDDVTISAGGFLIVARELIDGTDIPDTDSFESFYGNGDGVWDIGDGPYQAVDGGLSLANSIVNTIIVLSDGGAYSDTLTYNTSFGGNGNGRTIEKKDADGVNAVYNWQEGPVEGTPGVQNNQAPLASSITAGTDEDIEVIVYLDYTDAGDQAVSASVTGITGGTITTPASCTAGVCTVGLTPSLNSITDITASYTVNDGALDSNTALITVEVTPVNDAPIITSQNAVSMVEDSSRVITFTDIAVTDVDNAYPTDFTLTVQAGTNYNAVGNTITPSTNFNGGLTVPVTVNDGTAASAVFNMAVTVTPVNDAPVASAITTNTNEDTAKPITFSYSDVDAGDQAVSATVTGVTGGTITTPASCTAGVCTVGLMPSLNSIADIIASYTVNDGDVNSNSVAITVTVNPENDAPVVSIISDQEAVEGVEFTMSVSAIDVDNTQAQLRIDQASLPLWLQAGINGLEVTGTPSSSDVGPSPINLKVTDGSASSSPVAFNMMISPALEIDPEDVVIIIDGEEFTAEDTLTVAPGSEIGLAFTFSNNYDKTIAHIETRATQTGISSSSLLHEGVCSGVDCDSGLWVLEQGEQGLDEFVFDVPLDTPQGPFTLQLQTSYDNFWSFLPGIDDFIDTIDVTFEVEREGASVFITGISIDDDVLTCSRVTDIVVELTNVGLQDITPEVLIYSQEPDLASFDSASGEFTSFLDGTPATPLAEDNPDTLLSPGSPALPFPISVDVSSFSDGQHTLFIYVVNPYFNSDDFYVGDSAETEIEIDGCLQIEELESAFVFPSETSAPMEVDLIFGGYLDEDTSGLAYILEVTEQSDDDVARCEITGETLSCEPLAAGTSDITLAITVSGATIEETFRVTVSPSPLIISNVVVNGVPVAEGEETPSLHPEDDVVISLTVTNTLSTPITGAIVELSGPFGDLTSTSFNLNANQVKQVTLRGTIHLETTEGTYPADISVTGRDFNDNTFTHEQMFLVDVTIEQEAADLTISSATLEANAVSCQEGTLLTVGYTNRGSQVEDDAVITVTGTQVPLSREVAAVLPNTQAPISLNILTSDLISGTNILVVTLSYRNGFLSSNKTVILTKNNCLLSWTPTDDTPVIADGSLTTPLEFTVALQETDAGSVEWLIDGVLSDSTGTRFTLPEQVKGQYIVKAIVNDNPQDSHSWTVTVTDVPFSSNLVISEGATQTTVENSLGKIVFDDTNFFGEIVDIDQYLTITNNKVMVDSSAFPTLSGTATVTIKKSFTNPVILYDTGFATNPTTRCPTSRCASVSNGNGQFVFTVTGFSTYSVMEETPTALELSDISFTNAVRGENSSVLLTVKNQGTLDDITNIHSTLSVDNKYQAVLKNLPTRLGPLGMATIQLDIMVPATEDTEQHSIGSLTITGTDSSGGTIQTVKTISLDPKSFLTIESVEINGKTSGKFSLTEPNKIEVEVKNEFTQDMEDVTVTVSLPDTDDDVEEESEEFNLDKGDDDKVTVDIELQKDDVDDDTLTLDIVVEGTAEDGSQHTNTFTKEVTIDVEKHELVISKAVVMPAILECDRFGSIQVTIENLGKEDEDDLDITVRNAELGLELTRRNFDLENVFDDDNELRANFPLRLEDAASGMYTFQVELLQDDKLKESAEASVEVKSCLVEKKTEQQLDVQGKQLVKELEGALSGTSALADPVVKASFRDGRAYTVMLGMLTFLMLIAVLLGVVLIAKK